VSGLETILGGLIGGVVRFAPELLKFFDRKNERKHELSMQDRQIAFEQLRGNQRMAEIDAQTSAQQFVTAVDALKEGIKAQAQPSGIKWIDALSSLVRPLWTYLVLFMWSAVKWATYYQLLSKGLSWDAAVLTMWTPEDAGMLSMLGTFWFLDRVIRNATR
jgi:hypothetical protein